MCTAVYFAMFLFLPFAFVGIRIFLCVTRGLLLCLASVGMPLFYFVTNGLLLRLAFILSRMAFFSPSLLLACASFILSRMAFFSASLLMACASFDARLLCSLCCFTRSFVMNPSLPYVDPILERIPRGGSLRNGEAKEETEPDSALCFSGLKRMWFLRRNTCPGPLQRHVRTLL